jgi:hypothetical protein
MLGELCIFVVNKLLIGKIGIVITNFGIKKLIYNKISTYFLNKIL